MARSGIDTLSLARRLRERAGFTPDTAEETASAIGDALAGELATGSDLAELRGGVETDLAKLRGEVRTDLAELRGEVRADLADMKADLTRLVLTVATGQVALLIGAMLALVRLAR